MDYKALIRRARGEMARHAMSIECLCSHESVYLDLNGNDILALCDAVEALGKENEGLVGSFSECMVAYRNLSRRAEALEKDREDTFRDGAYDYSQSLTDAYGDDAAGTTIAGEHVVWKHFADWIEGRNRTTHNASAQAPTASTPTPAAPSDA